MTIEHAKEVLKIEAEGILALMDQVGPDFDKAIDLIMACPSRVILAGIGKSGIICQKIAATLNSTGIYQNTFLRILQNLFKFPRNYYSSKLVINIPAETPCPLTSATTRPCDPSLNCRKSK